MPGVRPAVTFIENRRRLSTVSLFALVGAIALLLIAALPLDIKDTSLLVETGEILHGLLTGVAVALLPSVYSSVNLHEQAADYVFVTLFLGFSFIFFYATSDILDEFLVMSDAIRLATQDLPIIIGMGLLVWGMVQWADERTEREEELAQQNERLETFANVVSHDLRNPLSVAQGYTELTRQEVGDIDSLDQLDESLDRMDVLIEDLLTLAQQGEPIEETEDVDLESLAADAWATAETKDAELETTGSVQLRIDRSRCRQLLENLFHNAVEHGGDDVTVTVGPLGKNGFFVADTGPGISESRRDDIFEYGYTTAQDGTGYGLATVKEIVEAHGGEITVADRDGGGARFEITEIKNR